MSPGKHFHAKSFQSPPSRERLRDCWDQTSTAACCLDSQESSPITCPHLDGYVWSPQRSWCMIVRQQVEALSTLIPYSRPNLDGLNPSINVESLPGAPSQYLKSSSTFTMNLLSEPVLLSPQALKVLSSSLSTFFPSGVGYFPTSNAGQPSTACHLPRRIHPPSRARRPCGNCDEYLLRVCPCIGKLLLHFKGLF